MGAAVYDTISFFFCILFYFTRSSVGTQPILYIRIYTNNIQDNQKITLRTLLKLHNNGRRIYNTNIWSPCMRNMCSPDGHTIHWRLIWADFRLYTANTMRPGAGKNDVIRNTNFVRVIILPNNARKYAIKIDDDCWWFSAANA